MATEAELDTIINRLIGGTCSRCGHTLLDHQVDSSGIESCEDCEFAGYVEQVPN